MNLTDPELAILLLTALFLFFLFVMLWVIYRMERRFFEDRTLRKPPPQFPRPHPKSRPRRLVEKRAMISTPPVKTKFPRAAALAVARDLHQWLSPFCERLIFAVSLRRRKATVGDVELLYIPLFGTVLFDTKQVSAVDVKLEALLADGFLDKRLNVDGHASWGDKNKLAVHAFSNIPVDLFAATPANWFNYLVCRTGSAESNTRIAAAAQSKGWKWNPYGMGFTDAHQRIIPVTSERDAFELVGLPYLEPWER